MHACFTFSKKHCVRVAAPCGLEHSALRSLPPPQGLGSQGHACGWHPARAARAGSARLPFPGRPSTDLFHCDCNDFVCQSRASPAEARPPRRIAENSPRTAHRAAVDGRCAILPSASRWRRNTRRNPPGPEVRGHLRSLRLSPRPSVAPRIPQEKKGASSALATLLEMQTRTIYSPL